MEHQVVFALLALLARFAWVFCLQKAHCLGSTQFGHNFTHDALSSDGSLVIWMLNVTFLVHAICVLGFSKQGVHVWLCCLANHVC